MSCFAIVAKVERASARVAEVPVVLLGVVRRRHFEQHVDGERVAVAARLGRAAEAVASCHYYPRRWLERALVCASALHRAHLERHADAQSSLQSLQLVERAMIRAAAPETEQVGTARAALRLRLRLRL